jgi:hypothetical protein
MHTLLLTLALALPAAGDKAPPKANTLTHKEAADGWLLLFDGETTFGWNGPMLAANPDRYGPLDKGTKVEAGVLHLGGRRMSAFGLPRPSATSGSTSSTGRRARRGRSSGSTSSPVRLPRADTVCSVPRPTAGIGAR